MGPERSGHRLALKYAVPARLRRSGRAVCVATWYVIATNAAVNKSNTGYWALLRHPPVLSTIAIERTAAFGIDNCFSE